MAIAAAVQREIKDRLGGYLVSGDATLSTHGYGPGVACDFEIVPRSAEAAAVFISVCADDVAVGVGNGVLDLRWDEREVWRRHLGQILEAVAEGRYTESVTGGRIFGRKVEMHFAGTDFTKNRYWNLAHDDDDDPSDGAPAVGERRYSPWRAAPPE